MIWLCTVYLILGVGVLTLMFAGGYELENILSIIIPILTWPVLLFIFSGYTIREIFKMMSKHSQK